MPLLRTASPHIARLGRNTKGRDLIVGDMHGCINAFNKLLDKANFDPSRDRVLCTGDLTHRGPNSLQCLELLKEPWFFSVRGNHEENTIDALNLHFGMPTTKADAFYQLAIDGGLWLCELVAKSLTKSPLAPLISQALADALYNLQNLPKIIIVGEGKSKYIVTHSCLLKTDKISPQDPKFFDKAIYSELEVEEVALGQAQILNPRLLNESKILGSYVKKLDNENKLQELSSNTLNLLLNNQVDNCPVFCGHTPLSKPTAIANHIHLDTGAGKADKDGLKRKLTMVDTKNLTIIQTKAGHAEPQIEPKDYAKKVEKAIERGEAIPTPK
jgi:serine/threonine protein phosphatase 1